MEKITGYSLSRNYFDWVLNDPDKGDAATTALYFFIIDEFNRSGWKDKIAIYTERCMAAMGWNSPKTYRKAFNRLVEYGFIKIVTKSKNQYQANIIALINTNILTNEDIEAYSAPEEIFVPNCGEVNNTQADFKEEYGWVNGEVNNTQAINGNNIGEVEARAKNTLTNTPILNNKTIKPNNINNKEIYSFNSVSEDDYLKVEDVEVYDPYKEFTEWIKENAPKVAKMKEPFTEIQYSKLFSEYNVDDIYNILEAMHNYEPLLKKSVSAYLTARNWLNRDKKSNPNNRLLTTQSAQKKVSKIQAMQDMVEELINESIY